MKKNKATVVLELLNTTSKTDHQIAAAAGCHVVYVRSLRRKMAHKVEEPQTAAEHNDKIKEMITDWRAEPDIAVDAILDERGSRYGTFVKQALISQRIKAVMSDTPNWISLEEDMVESLEMIASKLGRILNGDFNYADSWVDIAGYAQLIADRLNGKVR